MFMFFNNSFFRVTHAAIIIVLPPQPMEIYI